MAIKINLLPQSYDLKRKRARVGIGMGALLGLTALSIGLIYASDKKQLEKVTADEAAVKIVETQTTTAETATQAAESEAAPVKGVVAFMADASKTGAERAALLDLMRRYIYGGAVVSDLDLSNGTDAKIAATVRTPDEYARLLLSLRRGALPGLGQVFDGAPGASGVPGFPEGRPLPPEGALTYTPTPITFPFRIDAAGRLKTDPANPRNSLLFVPPEPPGTATAAVNAAGGAPGGSGGPPPGGPPASSPSPAPSGAPPP
jgi:hypothetical protein